MELLAKLRDHFDKKGTPNDCISNRAIFEAAKYLFQNYMEAKTLSDCEPFPVSASQGFRSV